MTNRESWIRSCLNDMRRRGVDVDSPTLDLDVLRIEGPEQWPVWCAHSIVRAFRDLNDGNTMFAFRGLLQAREYRGRCGGFNTAPVADALSSLQNEIETLVSAGGGR
jgi:hypothetical protein